MKQIKIIITSTLIALALTAAAKEAALSPANTKQGIKRDTQNEVRVLKENTKKEIDAQKQEVKAQGRAATSAKEALKEKREQFKEEAKTKREEAEIKIKAMRADLKDRLQKIKDEKKKQAVEKIADEIDVLHKRTLDHYSDVLDKLEKSLERIGERADRAESRGLNMVTVRTAIKDAEKANGESRVAITAQAGKTYKIEITTEGKLRADVQKAREALRADLKKVFESVRAAHDAVRKAAVTLAQIPRIDEGVATSTPPAPSPAPTSTSTETTPPLPSSATASTSTP